MSEWDWEKYLQGQIEEIKEMQKNGSTVREILDANRFCFEAMRECGLPISYLIPRAEGQKMDIFEWDTHTSSEWKWEFDGTPFADPYQRDRVFMGLLYSMGFNHMLEILPEESKRELFDLVKNSWGPYDAKYKGVIS